MRRVLILAVVFAWVLPAAAASAHVEGTQSPVVFLSTSNDCAATFGKMKAAIAGVDLDIDGQKQQFKDLTLVAAGSGGSGCEGAGASSQDFHEVAKAFAAWASAKYDKGAFDVVAEGPSGLALRYALAHNGDAGWPKLNVEDALTIGTPHDQLTDPGTDHPEGTQGTDWSAIGSDADEAAPGDRATAMNADHKTTYKDPGLTHQKLLDDVSDKLDAHIVYSHGDGENTTWNKAPHAAYRVANELAYGVDSCGGSNCTDSCGQTVATWKLSWKCPDRSQLNEGVTGVSVTTPSGTHIDVPEISGYALPVATARKLFVPVVLPDLHFSAGGFAISAYENSLDDDGVSIGTAGVVVPRAGEALAHDLKVSPKGNVSAGSLELEILGGQIGADEVKFGASGLTTKSATFALPDALGGSEARFRNLGIDAQGHVSGTLDGAKVKIGDITAEVTGATVTDNSFLAEDATLTLPKYLGEARLHAKNLRWDGNSFTIDQADGDIDFALAGGKVRVKSHVDFTLLPNGGYEIGGNGHVVVPQGSKPFFEADAALRVKSIDCDPAPGPCRNAAYLQHAAIGLRVERPIPLGTLGFALKGLHGSVKTDQQNPRRDAKGNIQGVVYTFGLGADVATFPNDSIFDGKIDGSLSTNGNFGLSLNGKTLRFIELHGGLCVLLDSLDTVCRDHLKPENRDKVAGTGAYVDASATASASYSGRLGSLSARLEASAFGRFVRSGDANYVDATLNGRFSASVHSWLFPDVSGTGSITAQLGRFQKPGGGAALGVKGWIEARLSVAGIGDSGTLAQRRAIFIDQDGHYTEENVDGYSLVTPPTGLGKASPRGPGRVRAAAADGSNDFELRPEQTQTAIVLEADDGSPTLELTTPGGAKAIVSNGAVQAAGGDRDELKNVYSVKTEIPHAVIAYLPAAQPGRWNARVVGAEPGHYRLDVSGNKPLPRVKVARRAKRRGKVATLRGAVSDAPRSARLSLYAGRTCATRGGAQLLAAGVRVRGGAWSYRLNTAKLAPGRYAIHAELDNGTGPMVGGCARGVVAVKAAPKRRKPAKRRRSRRAPAKPNVFERRIAPAPAKHEVKKPKPCKPPKGTPTTGPLPDPPVFWVTDSGADATADIAYNDAAAITGTDPSTGKPAVTFVRGQMGPPKTYRPKQPDELHWGLFNAKAGCQSISAKHRQEACGGRPFRDKGKPGPQDTQKKKTSCDEYPFASSFEGGDGAIIRGVVPSENTKQGKLLGGFLQRNAKKLARLDGLFYVCVSAKGVKTAHCRDQPG